MTTLELQKRLQLSGFDPGPIDGVMGRLTQAAIRAFQKARGLTVDGIVGPKTQAALLTAPGDPPSVIRPVSLPWFQEAKRLQGITEGAGAKDNATILGWAQKLGIWYPHDSIAWCGLMVAHCISTALPDEPLPANPLGARNWQKFGVTCAPQIGAVLTFWRGSKSSGLGHVGFMAGEDASYYHILGGNQSNAVSVARVSKARFLEARWPKTAPFLKTGSGAAVVGVKGEGSEA